VMGCERYYPIFRPPEKSGGFFLKECELGAGFSEPPCNGLLP